jgi:hypothetical protein
MKRCCFSIKKPISERFQVGDTSFILGGMGTKALFVKIK